MERSSEYLGLLITVIAAASIAGLMMALHVFAGPRNPSPEKSEPFECGVKPFALPAGHSSVKFYLIAMLFILFDIEVVWFFPWAVALRELSWAGLVEMFAFAAVLIIGFGYAWKKGALEWET